MPCPCVDCNEKVLYKLKEVRKHLVDRKRHPKHRVWNGPGDYDSSDAEWEALYRNQHMHPQRDEGMNLRPMIQNTFEHEDRVIDIALETLNHANDVNCRGNDANDNDVDDGQQPRNECGQFERVIPPPENSDAETFDPIVMEEAIQDLYEGAPSSKLGATIFLKNLFSVHTCTSLFVEDLLAGLHKDFLPAKNTLPKLIYGLTKLLSRLGLDYVNIDACVDGCVLFRKKKAGLDRSLLDRCPVCDEPRFRDIVRKKYPRKVLRHFPLIPHLQRTYRSPSLSELQLWHEQHKSTDGKVRFPADSRN